MLCSPLFSLNPTNALFTFVISYWFAYRTVMLCQEHLGECKSNLRQLDDTVKANKVKKKCLDEEKRSLEVAMSHDEVGQQIKDIEKDINELERCVYRLSRRDGYARGDFRGDVLLRAGDAQGAVHTI